MRSSGRGSEGSREQAEAYLILRRWWRLAARADGLEGYVEKALREAKLNTSWLEPNQEWEEGAKRYAVGLLADEQLGDFAARLAADAERVSLGMTLLKLTSPGIPDVYQGDELPYLALVDPDNRRPVNWELRRRLLGAPDAPPKLELIRSALALRARQPAAFEGRYEPLDAGRACAFTRGGEVLVAVAVRGGLDRFRLPAGVWQDVYRTPHLRLAERV